MKRGPGRPPSSSRKTDNVCGDRSGAEFFKVFLPRLTSHHLMIPPDFTGYFKRKIKDKVLLKDTLGKMWRVDVEENRKGVFLGRGWESFVDHHRLNTGDFLVFRYDSGCSFVVKVFGANGCKKERVATRVKIEQEEGSRGSCSANVMIENCDELKEAEGNDLPRGPYFSSFTGQSIEIPNEAIQAYDLESKQEMVLRDSNGKEWPVKTYTLKGGKDKSGHMYLGTGWSAFQEANNAASFIVRYMFTFGTETSSTTIHVRPVLQDTPDT